MSSIVVAGDTSGSITIAAPAVAGSGTLTLPVATDTLVGKATTDTLTNKSIAATQLTGTIAAAALPAGSVLQVVSTTSTTSANTTSSSMVTTGIGLSITPRSASSKILIMIQSTFTFTAASGFGISIARGASVVWSPCVSDATGFYGAFLTTVGTTNRIMHSIHYLDSPATTSSTTYNLYYATRNSSVLTVNPADSTAGGTVITLMEVQG